MVEIAPEPDVEFKPTSPGRMLPTAPNAGATALTYVVRFGTIVFRRHNIRGARYPIKLSHLHRGRQGIAD
jgi:hypothetical protein